MAALEAMISQMKRVARERATFVSFNLKMATRALAIVRPNIARVSTSALMGERRLKYAALKRA